MIRLYETGVYLTKNGLVPEAQGEAMGLAAPREAAKKTMAYRILEAHNTSDDMENLNIKFDQLASHDITFVGIIQTARASGLEKFPIPYVLTNCYNSLCAVGSQSAGRPARQLRWKHRTVRRCQWPGCCSRRRS